MIMMKQKIKTVWKGLICNRNKNDIQKWNNNTADSSFELLLFGKVFVYEMKIKW